MTQMNANGTPAGIGGRVLVTGGAGFIGSHLVERLVADGADVTVVDNLSSGCLSNLQAVLRRVTLVVGDLADLLRLNRLDLCDYGQVFHLAANAYIPPSVENPGYDFHANLYNTFMLLDALRRLPRPPRLTAASSAAVYGNPVRLPVQEADPTVPISPYGVSKLAGERYVAVYSQIYGLRATSLRFFSIYGPRQRKQVVYDLFLKLRANPRRIEVLGDGSQRRDFVYVTDVVQALVLAATVAPAEGEVYNVASGTTHTIAELVAAWCAVCGITPTVAYSGQVRPGDAQEWAVDLTNLRRLGFEPQIALGQGLGAIRDWYDAADT